MTDPTPKPWWPPHAARRHVQEPAPDAAPADPPTWPEDDPRRAAEASLFQLSIAYNDALALLAEERARAERAESNARGKQAVIEAQRATLDRARALAESGHPNASKGAILAILDAPQPEAGGDDE